MIKSMILVIYIICLVLIMYKTRFDSIGVILSIVSLLFLFSIYLINLKKERENLQFYNDAENKLRKYNKILIDKFLNKKQGLKRLKIPFYYINLKDSVSRSKYMENQAILYNINMKRVDGINGKIINKKGGKIKLTPEVEIDFVNKSKKNSVNEIACTLSHIKAIYNAYNNGDEIAIIAEDDASLSLYPYWDISIEGIINKAPSDWNIICIYSSFENNEVIQQEEFVKFHIPDNIWFGSVLYIINRKGMENVLIDILYENIINLDPSKIYNYNEDMESDTIIFYRAKNTYAYIKNSLVFTFNDTKLMDSTIHIDHSENHFNVAIKSIQNFLIKNSLDNINIKN